MPRPLLLGHRGLRVPGEPIENTIAAFDRALELGCDGFEFDVRRTVDGHAVICHDPQYGGCKVASVPYAQVRPLPLLDEVLARYAARAFLDIELKVPGLEATTLAALERYPSQHGFVVSSFYPHILQELRTHDAIIPLGFLCDRKSALAHWREVPFQYVIPHFSLLNRELFNELQKSGRKVMVWTVNKVDDILRFADWGVDGMISDDPALLAQTFRN